MVVDVAVMELIKLLSFWHFVSENYLLAVILKFASSAIIGFLEIFAMAFQVKKNFELGKIKGKLYLE